MTYNYASGIAVTCFRPSSPSFLSGKQVDRGIHADNPAVLILQLHFIQLEGWIRFLRERTFITRRTRFSQILHPKTPPYVSIHSGVTIRCCTIWYYKTTIAYEHLTLERRAGHRGNHPFWYPVNHLKKKARALIGGRAIVQTSPFHTKVSRIPKFPYKEEFSGIHRTLCVRSDLVGLNFSNYIYN